MRRIVFDVELVHQRIGVQRLDIGFLLRAQLKIHQAPAQMGAIDPGGDGGVMRIGHQQGGGKAAQQAFGRAFPFALALLHLYQLARKGHGIHRQA